MVSNWLNWFYSFIQTFVSWLSSMTIMSIPVAYIILGFALLGVTIRAILYKA